MEPQQQPSLKPANSRHILAPSTPSRHNADINAILKQLAVQYRLPLHVRDNSWSPSRSTKTDGDRCVDYIKYLYFQDRETLQQSIASLADFEPAATPGRVLNYFVKTLEDRTRLVREGRRLFAAATSPRARWPKAASANIDNAGELRGNSLVRDHESKDDTGHLPLTRLDTQPLAHADVFSSSELSHDVSREPRASKETTRNPKLQDVEAIKVHHVITVPGIPSKALSTSAEAPTNTRSRPTTPVEDPMDMNMPDSPTPATQSSTRLRVRGKKIWDGAAQAEPTISSPEFAYPWRPRAKKRSTDEFENTDRSPKKVLLSTQNSDRGSTKPFPAKHSFPAQTFLSATTSFGSTATSVSLFDPRSDITTANTSFTSIATDADSVADDKGTAHYTSCLPDFSNAGTRTHQNDADLACTVNHSRGRAPSTDILAQAGVYGTVQESGPHRGKAEDQLRTRFPDGTSSERKDGANVQNMHYQVRDLANQDLLGEQREEDFAGASMRVRYECLRLSLSLGCQLSQVVPRYTTELEDYDVLWEHFKAYADRHNQHLPKRTSSETWKAAASRFDNVSLKGSMSINASNIGPLLILQLEPLVLERSCRFQRRFGGDRFLYLNVPSFNSRALPSHLKDQLSHIESMYAKWLIAEKHLLGRSWRVLLIENRKKKKGVRSRNANQIAGQQLVLFATDGHGLRQRRVSGRLKPSDDLQAAAVTIAELFSWFLPFEENEQQLFCKAYARLELGLSKTIPTVTFKPSQVKWVDDIKADGAPECDSFNDTELSWHTLHDPRDPKVMNDGCSRMSVGAAKSVWSKLKKHGPVPSAFQGRMGGWKGVWMISAPTDTRNPSDADIWIEVTPSQTKFLPHDEDLDDNTYDPHRLTLEVLKDSGPPSTSTFHVAFLPILHDRGVCKETLVDFVIERLNLERNSMKEGMTDVSRLRRWVHDKHSMLEDASRGGDMHWQGGLPHSLPEKVTLLVEYGFDPRSCAYLKDVLFRLIEKYLSRTKQTLTFPIGRSSYLLAVADPIKVLRPGQVHLAFSTNFQDDESGESYYHLNGVNMLVARHPALRASDIQKVHAVYRAELSHLKDVMVFPSTGCYPLAQKLQGGDYDGDTFWICWEPSLVDSFRNAPPPLHPQTPQALGIAVENMTLGETLTGPGGVDSFLKKSFDFRCRPDMLGICTLFHEKLVYAEDSIRTPGTSLVSDLHDYLVDCAKNGYIYTKEAWTKFIRETPSIRNKRILEPAYRSAMKSRLELAGRSPLKSRSSLKVSIRGEASPVKLQPPPAKYKPEHITDYLVFEVIQPHNAETLAVLESFCQDDCKADPDLEALYLRELNYGLDKKEDSIVRVLKEATSSIGKIFDFWTRSFTPKLEFDADTYNETLGRCFEMYCAILPSTSDRAHQRIEAWVTTAVGYGPAYWELLKSSALYVKYRDKATFAFSLAGRELAIIKALSTRDSRFMIPSIWAIMKPKRLKRLEVEDDTQGGEGERDDKKPDDDPMEDYFWDEVWSDDNEFKN